MFSNDFFRKELFRNRELLAIHAKELEDIYLEKQKDLDEKRADWRNLSEEERYEVMDWISSSIEQPKPYYDAIPCPYFMHVKDADHYSYISSDISFQNILKYTSSRASYLRYNSPEIRELIIDDDRIEVIVLNDDTNTQGPQDSTFDKNIRIIEPSSNAPEEIVSLARGTNIAPKAQYLTTTKLYENKRGNRVISNIADTLAQEQDLSMRTPKDSNTLITGPAWSGKTNALLHRIDYLISEERLEWNEIALFCFNVWLKKYLEQSMSQISWSHWVVLSFDKWQEGLMSSVFFGGIPPLDYENKQTLWTDEDVLEFIDRLYLKYSSNFLKKKLILAFSEKFLLSTEEIGNLTESTDKNDIGDKQLEKKINALEKNISILEKQIKPFQKLVNKIEGTLNKLKEKNKMAQEKKLLSNEDDVSKIQKEIQNLQEELIVSEGEIEKLEGEIEKLEDHVSMIENFREYWSIAEDEWSINCFFICWDYIISKEEKSWTRKSHTTKEKFSKLSMELFWLDFIKKQFNIREVLNQWKTIYPKNSVWYDDVSSSVVRSQLIYIIKDIIKCLPRKYFVDNKEKSRLFEYYEHILVDEFQDLWSHQLMLINIFSNQGITIAGDMTQSLYLEPRNGNIKFPFPIHHTFKLAVTHRSTLETIQFANAILHKDNSNYSRSQIFTQQGDKPLICKLSSEDRMSILIKRAMEKYPTSSFLVTAHAKDDCEHLKKLFHKGGLPEAYIASGGVWDFNKNLHIANYFQVKGLEFDFVIVTGLGDFLKKNYVSNKENILYTILTRAKQRVIILHSWEKEIENMLEKIDPALFESITY